MILINLSHPLSESQLEVVEQLVGGPIERLVDPGPSHFDHEQPFADQVRALVDSLPLDAQAWQTLPILLNPPSHNLIAVTLLAELHGRMGYFPAVLRLKPVQPPVGPTRFEPAEIVNLQAVRDTSRARRGNG